MLFGKKRSLGQVVGPRRRRGLIEIDDGLQPQQAQPGRQFMYIRGSIRVRIGGASEEVFRSIQGDEPAGDTPRFLDRIEDASPVGGMRPQDASFQFERRLQMAEGQEAILIGRDQVTRERNSTSAPADNNTIPAEATINPNCSERCASTAAPAAPCNPATPCRLFSCPTR